MKKKIWIAGVIVGIIIVIAVLLIRHWSDPRRKELPPQDLFENQGLDEVIEYLGEHEQMGVYFTIAYMNVELYENGGPGPYSLTVEAYDADYQHLGGYRFERQQTEGEGADDSNWQLTVGDRIPGTAGLVETYDPNSDISYMNSQIKQLPLQEQLKLLDFDHYYLSCRGTEQPMAGEPVIDGTGDGEYPLYNLAEYQRGEGGVSDGSTAVILRLSDGSSSQWAMGDSETGRNMLAYLCAAADEEALVGSASYAMECDYYVNNNQLFFTRDAGENWIEADISEAEMAETLEAYGNGIEIPEYSYSIKKDCPVIAFFYGAVPTLRLSVDDGKSWTDKPVPVGTFKNGDYPRRSVNFYDENNGYIVIGTDYSPGSGKGELGFVTRNGGDTWEPMELPEPHWGNLFNGLFFTDSGMTEGVVSLRHDSHQDRYPTLYYTKDSGVSWQEIKLPEEGVPEEMTYLTKVSDFTKEDGNYTLVLRYETSKYQFTSDSPLGNWQFDLAWEENIHTVG